MILDWPLSLTIVALNVESMPPCLSFFIFDIEVAQVTKRRKERKSSTAEVCLQPAMKPTLCCSEYSPWGAGPWAPTGIAVVYQVVTGKLQKSLLCFVLSGASFQALCDPPPSQRGGKGWLCPASQVPGAAPGEGACHSDLSLGSLCWAHIPTAESCHSRSSQSTCIQVKDRLPFPWREHSSLVLGD